MKIDLQGLMKAYEALEEHKSEVPEEFKFLLDPQFKEELQNVQSNAEKIYAAAQMVGDQVGEENVNTDTVEEIVAFLKENKLLNEVVPNPGEMAPPGAIGEPKEKDSLPIEAGPKEKPQFGAPKKDEPKEDDKKLDKTAKIKQRALKMIEHLLDLD